jgi:hypothetical protein
VVRRLFVHPSFTFFIHALGEVLVSVPVLLSDSEPTDTPMFVWPLGITLDPLLSCACIGDSSFHPLSFIPQLGLSISTVKFMKNVGFSAREFNPLRCANASIISRNSSYELLTQRTGLSVGIHVYVSSQDIARSAENRAFCVGRYKQ